MLELVAGEGYGTADVPDSVGAMQTYGRLPLDSDLPLCDSVRRRTPVFLRVPGGAPGPLSQPRPDRGPGFGAWAILPLLTQGQVVGGACARVHGAADVQRGGQAQLAAIGLQAAQAIARARLFEAEQARARPPRPRMPRPPSCTG